MANYPIEALLRPPVEWSTTVAALSMGGIVLLGHDRMLMTSKVAYGLAALLTVLALVRFWQGLRVVRYQQGLSHNPPYWIPSKELDPDPEGLMMGRGFRWTALHTQRLWDATRAGNQRFVQGSRRTQEAAKAKEPLSGLPALHGVGLLEGQRRIVLPHAERQGHMFYVGTTGVGKTRAAELAILQDIRRGHPVICMDPKGDPDLFRGMYAEAVRSKRLFYFFHLGYPDHSARYNPIGRFTRITEVATRIANQLPSQGNAEAFRQFAWLFTHIIARAVVTLGEQPDYRKTLQHMNNIEPLLVRYFEAWLDRCGPEG